MTIQVLEDFHSAERTGALKAVADADSSYRSKLEKFQKTAQDAGNLKSVLAAKAAITEIDAGRPLLVSDDAGVAAIQKTHTALRQKAEAESAKAIAKIDQDYLASLKKLVADLTKAGKIEQAVEVQAKVDALAAAPQPGAATPNPGAEEIEIWKKKAMEEFPVLKDPASQLSKRVKALTEKKKATTPSFFKNPQWPYLLAKEANQSNQPNKVIETPHAKYDIKPFHETALLRKGRKMFSDRDYEWGEIPDGVLDWGYTRQKIRQPKEISVKREGMVFICTKFVIEDERDVLLKKIIEAGWTEAGLGEIFEPNVKVKWLILKKEFKNGLHSIPVWDERVGTIIIRPDLKEMLSDVTAN